MKLITDKENKAWVKNLPAVVYDLNNSITHLLDMTLAEAIKKESVYVLPSKIRRDRPVGINEKRLPSGSLVRYLLAEENIKGQRRATNPVWSTKLFTIESSTVINGQPVIYRLSEGPKKYFVHEELMLIPHNTMLPPAYILYGS